MKYLGQLSVDTRHHVITGAGADFADKRDSQCLEKIVEQASENLKANDIEMQEVLKYLQFISFMSGDTASWTIGCKRIYKNLSIFNLFPSGSGLPAIWQWLSTPTMQNIPKHPPNFATYFKTITVSSCKHR